MYPHSMLKVQRNVFHNYLAYHSIILDINFTMSVDSEVILEFNFENVMLIDGILPSATLWLFPDNTINGPQVKDVEFIVTVSCPWKQYGTEHHVVLKWNTEVPCLSLDVTLPIKRLLKFLDRSEEHYALLVIQVASISDNKGDNEMADGEEMCRRLEHTDPAAPFLYLQFAQFNSDQATDSRRRRTILRPPVYPTCGVIPLVVDLVDLGINITAPQTADIGLCFGNCGHSIVPNRALAQLAVDAGSNQYSPEVESKIGEEECCVPSTYGNLTVMQQDTFGFKIIEIVKAIVTSCECR